MNLRCADGPPTPRTGPCKPADTFDKLAGMPLPTARPIPKQGEEKDVRLVLRYFYMNMDCSFTEFN